MRRARITYQGAYHHAMNRGHDGRSLFQDDPDREFFLDLVKIQSKNLKIRVFAYCLMNNHFHLVIENTSGRLSDFFKQLNGQYASHFRQKYRGRGYVYQDRFKSLLIQDESYLMTAIGYILNNPVRAKLVNHFLDFRWSSANLYFCKGQSEVVDNEFVEALFQSEHNLKSFIENLSIEALPTVQTRMGKIVGEKSFIKNAIEKFNRRTTPEYTLEAKRIDDLHFISVQQVYQEFRQIHGENANEMDTDTFGGKRLRAELLVHLKDRAGLTYSEIVKLPEFSDVKLVSLGAIYRNAKIRMGKRQ
jgi:REP element-mobilizing transposase RayT